MADLSGKYWSTLEEQLVQKAANFMLELERRLTLGGAPYGAVDLAPEEQAERFLEMAPEDYKMLVANLNEKYRGLPDAYERVNQDLANFLADMILKTGGV